MDCDLKTKFASFWTKIDEIHSKKEEYSKVFIDLSTRSHSKKEQETSLTNLQSCLVSLLQEIQNQKVILNEAEDRLQLRTTETSSNEIDTQSQIDALNKELERLTKENEELKSKVEELEQKLTDQNNSLDKRIRDVVAKKNTEFETALTNLCQRSSNLEKENAELRVKLKSKDNTFALGLIGLILETEIWKFVLSDEEPVKRKILATMEIQLVKNCSEGNEEAQKRWDDLKLTLNWNEKKHRHALGIFEQFIGTRMDGDPRFEDVDLEVARKQLKSGSYVSGPNIGMCEEIIDMLLAVREMNEK